MDFLIPAGQLILSLSILVILHELGHFIPAMLFGTRVEKFYLFFDPWFSLFKKKVGETEYGIGWLPLGGYVKISGMIDESMDKEQMQGEPQPWEFRSKTSLQRLIIMIGGVTVNFILGILIFIGILNVWGESFIPNKNVTDGIAVGTVGAELGLQDGDKIISIGDAPFKEFNAITIIKEIAINDASSISVERNNKIISLPVPDNMAKRLTSDRSASKNLISLRHPFEVAGVPKNSSAAKAGLKAGDRIVGVGGQSAPFYNDFVRLSEPYFGKDVPVTVNRDGDSKELMIPLTEEGKIGITTLSPISFFDIESKKYNLGEAIPKGYEKAVSLLTDQIKAFGQMFKGKLSAKDNLGSFITIGKQFGTTWDWHRFWNMTGMLSLILGFINLLPIPALDGGHVMFLQFEWITGIKPSDKVLEIAITAGFFLIMALMIYALGLDISRLF